MNKKLTKILATSLSCITIVGVGIGGMYYSTSCASSTSVATKLVIDNNKISDIFWTKGSSIPETTNLSGSVKTDLGQPVTDNLQFSITPNLPNSLSIHPSTGVISGIPNDSSDASYIITVTATVDGKTLSGMSKQFNIKITDAPTPTKLVISAIADDIPGVIGLPISSTTALTKSIYLDNPSTQKVTSGLTFSTDPALPNGLSIDSSTGVISGTPTVALSSATYKIKVSATVQGISLNGQSNDFSITINDPSQVTLVIDDSKINDIVDEYNWEIDQTTDLSKLVKTNLGLPVAHDLLQFSITPNLPDGLRFDEFTGIITGKPKSTSSGTYKIKVSATVEGKTLYGESKSFNITISEPVVPTGLVIKKQIGNIDCDVNSPVYESPDLSEFIYLDNPSTKRIPWGFTFSTEPALPNGLSIDSSTGIIKGIPTATFSGTNYKIKVSGTLNGYYLEGFSNSFDINIVEPTPEGYTIQYGYLSDELGQISEIASEDIGKTKQTPGNLEISPTIAWDQIGLKVEFDKTDPEVPDFVMFDYVDNFAITSDFKISFDAKKWFNSDLKIYIKISVYNNADPNIKSNVLKGSYLFETDC